MGVVGVLVLAAAATFGIPYIRRTLATVSTDDAFVNGHVTCVAPRVGGQISRVVVDDNNRVHKGDLIAELDKEPYQIALSQKSAAVDTADGGSGGGHRYGPRSRSADQGRALEIATCN